MRISTIYAAAFVRPPDLDTETIKQIGATWGSWKTWRACATDNVICHDVGHARELYRRSLHKSCNLYLPEKFYNKMSRPMDVRFYQGDFQEDIQDLEDVVAMHLVAGISDLVLMFGYDLSNPGPILDRMVLRSLRNRLGLIRSCLAQNHQVQWVAINHDRPLDPAFGELTNLTCDQINNVLQLLV